MAANAAGGAFAAGNKSDETAINQAIKLRQIELRRRTIDPSIRLKYADGASEQWYRDHVTALRDEQRVIHQSPQTPEEKAAQYKSLRERARALAAEFQAIKAQNRRAHGLSDDGGLLPEGAGSAGPERGKSTSGHLAVRSKRTRPARRTGSSRLARRRSTTAPCRCWRPRAVMGRPPATTSCTRRASPGRSRPSPAIWRF